MASLSHSAGPLYKNLLVVIKQTAFEEYTQLRIRGLAPKALRWSRLESRFTSHKSSVESLISTLKTHHPAINFTCVNRVDLDRQHLQDVDLVVAVGGDGTVLSSAHFLDYGSIPLLGINSDPTTEDDQINSMTKGGVKLDERRSHGALCMFTSSGDNIKVGMEKVLYGGGFCSLRSRVQVTVKSAFSETKLVPGLNDVLLSAPSPASVTRFRMGFAVEVGNTSSKRLHDYSHARFGTQNYKINNSLNIWSSGLWLSSSTGSTAAMSAAGGVGMNLGQSELQYLVREHLIEKGGITQTPINPNESLHNPGKGLLDSSESLHIRFNSKSGKIYIDGSYLEHDLELGDEILINNRAPGLMLFMDEEEARIRKAKRAEVKVGGYGQYLASE